MFFLQANLYICFNTGKNVHTAIDLNTTYSTTWNNIKIYQ